MHFEEVPRVMELTETGRGMAGVRGWGGGGSGRLSLEWGLPGGFSVGEDRMLGDSGDDD